MIVNVYGLGAVNVEAIGYSVESDGSTVRHKFGSSKVINEWAERTRKKYNEHGLSDMAEQIQVIDVERLPREEVEKMLNICDYIGTFLRRSSGGTTNS